MQTLSLPGISSQLVWDGWVAARRERLLGLMRVRRAIAGGADT
ncbi:MAG: hypothetical protein ABIP75_09375 [Pyrinomonadaceae bacterium]